MKYALPTRLDFTPEEKNENRKLKKQKSRKKNGEIKKNDGR